MSELEKEQDYNSLCGSNSDFKSYDRATESEIPKSQARVTLRGNDSEALIHSCIRGINQINLFGHEFTNNLLNTF